MNFDVDVEVEWNPGKKKQLLEVDDKILYTTARMTYDLSFTHIPMKSGHMRMTSAIGVQGSPGHYYIGSYTDYAEEVWDYPDSTNWTTPDTFGKWYETIWKQKQTMIMKQAIEENKLK